MNKHGKWTTLEKEEFIKCLEKKDFDAFEKLKYFEGNSLIKAKTARKLLEKIYFDFDEDDLEIQEKFYLFLDKIIDGISRAFYKSDINEYYEFKSINKINSYILKRFKYINDLDYPEDTLKELAKSLLRKTQLDLNYFDECYKNVLLLFEDYQKNGNISREVSTDFYNDLLNRQQDVYVNYERENLIRILCEKLHYTKRKEVSRINGVKLRKFNLLFKEHNYEKLGINEEELRAELKSFASYFSSLKEIRKENVTITDSQCDLMTEKFFNASLTEEDVLNICAPISSKGANIIFNKYTQVKMRFLENINVSDDELPDLKLGYNYNNYKIVNKSNYFENLFQVFMKINESDALKLLEEVEKNESIFLLIFFIDYFKLLDTKNVLAILKNYSRITRDFGNISFDQLLDLGLAYNNANDFVMAVLGKDTVEKIVLNSGMTSKDSNDYVDVYLNMLRRDKTSVPPVSGELKNYYYESSHDADTDRLLIGKICQASCIGPDGAGEDAFLSCLTGRESDVILFKDKETKELVARTLCFRKGNFVILAPIYGTEDNTSKFYNPKLLSMIVSEMLEKAHDARDNIDYIFITDPEEYLRGYYLEFDDDCLVDSFPHADLYSSKYLIGYKNFNDINLKPDEEFNVYYDTKREKIRHKNELNSDDINRICILENFFTQDKYFIEDSLKKFTMRNKDDYDEVVLGQDWCIMIKDGKIVDKVILPVPSERQENELISVYSCLLDLGIIEDVFDELYNNYSHYGK